MFNSVTGRGYARAIMVILLVLLAVGESACSLFQSNTTAKPTATKAAWTFVVVTDGVDDDPFWLQMQQGIKAAATRTHVETRYQAPYVFNISMLSVLIDYAVSNKPDGLVISIPDCDKLTPALKRAQLVAIPVIGLDAGRDCATKLELLSSLGPTGYEIGMESGARLVAAGATNVLCINQGPGNTEMENRCKGVGTALTKAGGKSEILEVNLGQPTTAVQKIQRELAVDHSINAIITLNAIAAPVALTALQNSGHVKDIKLATFDLSNAILQAIRQGQILFAVDRKPYTQGYQSIVLLSQFKNHEIDANNTAYPVNINFVTKDNVQQVQETPIPGLP